MKKQLNKLKAMKNSTFSENGIFTSKINGFQREGKTSMGMVLVVNSITDLLNRMESTLQSSPKITGTVELF